MPIAVNHPTAVAHAGLLYVHGGYTSATGLSQPTAALLRFDPEPGRWRRLPSSRTPRAAHAAAVLGDRLYVAGGANDSGSLRSLEIYDFRRARWRPGPSFPGPARNHTTGVASGGRFYVLAGRDSGNLTDAERFDPRRRVWEELPPLRVGRGGIASVRLRDGRIVVFGGERLEPGGTTIAEVELFDPRRRRWSTLPDLRTPRHGLGGAALGRRVFAIEGGPTPGLDFSRTIEFLDVPPRP
jgi:N-acetylneuraminic acid mutarotase